jgi:hypothetical protein
MLARTRIPIAIPRERMTCWIETHSRLALQTIVYEEFVSMHRESLVCAETTNLTWVIERLLDDGAKLQLALGDGSYFLDHAQFP